MRTLVILLLMTSCVLGQETDTTKRVAALLQSVTPEVPRRTGVGFEYLQYQSRVRELRLAAIAELGTLGQDAAAAVPLLSKLLNDKYEPLNYKLAMVDTLQKIGPASQAAIPALKQLSSSSNTDGKVPEVKHALLTIAAERAILFIESKPEEAKARESLAEILPCLQNIANSQNAQTIQLVYSFYRHRDAKSHDHFIDQFNGIVIDPEKKLDLIVSLLNAPAGRDLGRTLLNSSFVDGKLMVTQLLVTSRWPYAGSTCFDHLNERHEVAREILNDVAIDDRVWETTFTKYKTTIIKNMADLKQEQLSEVISLLRRNSAIPGRRSELAIAWLFEPTMMDLQVHGQREGIAGIAIWIRDVANLNELNRQIAFDWLSNTWAITDQSDSSRVELVEAAKRIVSLVNPSNGLLVLQQGRYQKKERMRFIAQLLPDFRVTPADRDLFAEQLFAAATSNNFDLAVVERMLFAIIRMKPPEAPLLPPPVVEQFLVEGRFAEGEAALRLLLEADPKDDGVRFGLGVLQFARAIEKLGQSLYKYGALSEITTIPFLRLPVPKNESPSVISFEEFGVMLDAFAMDLGKAQETLALITDNQVKLPLRLANYSFDFTGTGENRTKLLTAIEKLSSGRPFFAIANPELRVHFDRGDVAWLRAYCHLLSASVDCYRAVVHEDVFLQEVAWIFPNVKSSRGHADQTPAYRIALLNLGVVDAPRLRSTRLHLLAVCELNKETWMHIRNEEDNDYEWLAHPLQTDPFLLPLTDQVINSWLAMMKQIEGLLRGELLVPGELLNFLSHTKIGEDRGLNVQKLLDDPPIVLIRNQRLFGNPLDDKYLEPLTSKRAVDVGALLAIPQMFEGPLGFAQAARLN